MKTFAPDYYKEFKCIADKCRHSCCIGWEIDIDRDTLAYYKNVGGNIGQKLKENISKDKEPHFLLDENERCPFLNSHNLCDIYTELGEEHLCQICSNHPRFRSFFDSRTEIGLGMCCEAAAWLILNRKEKMTFIETGGSKGKQSPDDEVFFNLRQKAFDILQDRKKSIDKRIAKLRKEFDIPKPERTSEEWTDFYLTLENLDPEWKKLLENAKNADVSPAPCFEEDFWQIAFEQLAVYFVFRHTADAVCENNLKERLALALLSFEFVRYLCSAGKNISIEALADISRMYSAEIEYSEENIDELLFELENELL